MRHGSHELERLLRVLRRVRRRLRWQAALDGAARGGVGAGLVLVAHAAASRVAFGRGLFPLGVAAALAAILMVASTVAASLRRLSLSDVAARVDRTHGLFDRVSAALEFSRLERVTPFMRAAIADGVRAAEPVLVSRAAPLSRPRRLGAAMLLLLSALLVARFPSLAAGKTDPASTLPNAEREPRWQLAPEQLEPEQHAARELLRDAVREGNKEVEKTARGLLGVHEELVRGGLSRREALERLARLEEESRKSEDARQQDGEQQSAKEQRSKRQKQQRRGQELVAETRELVQRSGGSEQSKQAEKQAEKQGEKQGEKQERQRRENGAGEQSRESGGSAAQASAGPAGKADTATGKGDGKGSEGGRGAESGAGGDGQAQLGAGARSAGNGAEAGRERGHEKEGGGGGEKGGAGEKSEASRRADLAGAGKASPATTDKAGQAHDLAHGRERGQAQGDGASDGAAMRAFLARARGEKNSAGESSASPVAGAQGAQTGFAADASGARKATPWGDEHDSNLYGSAIAAHAPSKLRAVHAGAATSAGSGAAEPKRADVILGSSERGFSSLSYRRVFRDYTAITEDVLEREQVPPGYRYYIQRYFQLIHPRD